MHISFAIRIAAERSLAPNDDKEGIQQLGHTDRRQTDCGEIYSS